jgi:hypothetical protein
MDARHADELRTTVAKYLHTRRALGYTQVRTEKLLRQFIDYPAVSEATGISTMSALSWANLPEGSDGS